MEKWLTILFFFVAKIACCQTSFYINAIDSLAATNDQSNLNYWADSIYQPSVSSLFINTTSVKFYFSDYKGKRLIKADEITANANDTTHIIYYFHEKQVIKIVAERRKKHFAVDQTFYFNNNKMVYPWSLDNSPFSQMNLMERAKLYLKFNTKKHHQRIHGCDE